mmetsp:Transcript_45461/g.115479  ORF Transcript_45461/g.115479 Transcript_45461/m.115479 type:complete len:254 (+) Transcript_45461:1-762(+)
MECTMNLWQVGRSGRRQARITKLHRLTLRPQRRHATTKRLPRSCSRLPLGGHELQVSFTSPHVLQLGGGRCGQCLAGRWEGAGLGSLSGVGSVQSPLQVLADCSQAALRSFAARKGCLPLLRRRSYTKQACELRQLCEPGALRRRGGPVRWTNRRHERIDCLGENRSAHNNCPGSQTPGRWQRGGVALGTLGTCAQQHPAPPFRRRAWCGTAVERRLHAETGQSGRLRHRGLPAAHRLTGSRWALGKVQDLAG